MDLLFWLVDRGEELALGVGRGWDDVIETARCRRREINGGWDDEMETTCSGPVLAMLRGVE